jgi:hypothetical protein
MLLLFCDPMGELAFVDTWVELFELAMFQLTLMDPSKYNAVMSGAK